MKNSVNQVGFRLPCPDVVALEGWREPKLAILFKLDEQIYGLRGGRSFRHELFSRSLNGSYDLAINLVWRHSQPQVPLQALQQRPRTG